MKIFLSTIAVICMVFSIQANTPKNQNRILNFFLLDNIAFFNIDLLTMKAEIESNTRSYYITGSLTIVTERVVKGASPPSLVLSFRNSSITSPSGSNYIQAITQARRNDNNRNNEVRVYVHHDNTGNGTVDVKKVKINWKDPETGEITGILSNVTAIYKKYSILITGSFQKGGHTIGVSLIIKK